RRFGRESQTVQQRVAAHGEIQVIRLAAGQQSVRVQQARRAPLIGDLEVAVQVLQSQRACKALPAGGHLGGRRPRHSGPARVRLLIAITHAEIERPAARTRSWNAVEDADVLQARGVLDFRAGLVAALVDPASLETYPCAGS